MRSQLAGWGGLALLAGVLPLAAGDKPVVVPAVTAITPLAVPQGFKGTVRLRGFKFKETTGIRVEAATKPDKLELKEKKESATPTGFTASLTGDGEVLVYLELPPGFPVGPLALVVEAGGMNAAPVELQVLPEKALLPETEPNNGFSTGMKLEPGQEVSGSIQPARDVDVFQVTGHAGKSLKVSVIAGKTTSLLDPLLTVFDAAGQQLAVKDDQGKTDRDASVEVTPAVDGPILITIQDAMDTGSDWHAYRLQVSAPGTAVTGPGKVSFAREIWPVLRANCVSCHRPGKLKGGLDLSTFASLIKGGKNGEVVKPGAPPESPLVEVISGDEPEMPPTGEWLTAPERALLAKWVEEGAVDDSPPEGLFTRRPTAVPVYQSLPAVPAMAFSPDGSLLAVAGYYEILIHRADGSGISGRWPGDSPRLETLAFSKDGKQLAACGGSPSEFGEIQIWEVAAGRQVRSIRAGTDTLYGVSWSDNGQRLAVGGADKLVRAFDAGTGNKIMECDNHLDWVFGTGFVHDGSKLVSVSRDKGVKLIDVATGHLIDDAARPREPVLALAVHPREDLFAFTGTEGRVRLHKMAPRGGRLKEGDDKEESSVREFEHMATPLQAVAFSADGNLLACGGLSGEVRIFETGTGKRKFTLPAVGGPVFALSFHPSEPRLAVAGSDGNVRFYDCTEGKLTLTFPAVPLAAAAAANTNAAASPETAGKKNP